MIAKLPPCTIGMEACSGAHHWARLFLDCVHTVRLVAPKFVTPYRMSGKTRLGSITKAGDSYLHSLLVLDARALLAAAKSEADALNRWATALSERRGYWKAVVAIAANSARMAWAVLHRGEAFVLPA